MTSSDNIDILLNQLNSLQNPRAILKAFEAMGKVYQSERGKKTDMSDRTTAVKDCADQNEAVGAEKIERLTAMRRYIEKTGGGLVDATSRYQMNFGELMALKELVGGSVLDALILAFEYGKAKGYRAARNEAKRRATV